MKTKTWTYKSVGEWQAATIGPIETQEKAEQYELFMRSIDNYMLAKGCLGVLEFINKFNPNFDKFVELNWGKKGGTNK